MTTIDDSNEVKTKPVVQSAERPWRDLWQWLVRSGRLYPLAMLFVLFLIYNSPTGSGNFATFLVQLLGAFGEFLIGLFGGGESVSPEPVVPTVPIGFEPASGFYSGQAMDITGNGQADIVLFGSTDSPLIHEVPKPEPAASDVLTGGLAVAVAGGLFTMSNTWLADFLNRRTDSNDDRS